MRAVCVDLDFATLTCTLWTLTSLRPRIVPSGNPDTFKLLWSTNNSAKAAVGNASGSYSTIIDATTSRLTKDMMCGGHKRGLEGHRCHPYCRATGHEGFQQVLSSIIGSVTM